MSGRPISDRLSNFQDAPQRTRRGYEEALMAEDSRSQERDPRRRKAEISTVSVHIQFQDSANVDYGHFCSWLQRKARNDFRIYKHIWSKNQLEIYVQDEAVSSITRLDGFTYNNQVLKISSDSPGKVLAPSRFDTPEISAILQDFIRSRYLADRGLLDFSNIAAVGPLMEILTMVNMVAWNALFKATLVVCPDVSTISFNSNKLRTIFPICGLSNYLPNVANLSFAHNEISDLKSLSQVLVSMKNLREIVLLSNPVAQLGDYRHQVAKIFPNLQILDTLPLERIAAPSPSNHKEKENEVKLPLNPNGSFFDSEETRNMAGGFLVRYMHLFDTDRKSLIDVYAPTAVFSAAVNPFTPLSLSESGTSGRRSSNRWDVSDLDFTLAKPRKRPNWWDLDRNISRSTDKESRMKRQYTNPNSILQILSDLPPTQHKHPQTYLIDAWQVQNLGMAPQLFINTHGEFTDDTKQERYFDRVFILIPSVPGSKAALNGWPVEIVNDSLCVRSKPNEEAYKRIQGRRRRAEVKELTSLDKFNTLPPVIGSGAVVSEAPTPGPIHQKQQNQQLSPHQQQIALELSRETGLNMEFSVMCLNEQGWDKMKALSVFYAAKMENRIPPHAFIH